MHDFERWHGERFGTTPPLGYCLRTDHPSRWLRLHSLPGSKRYASDDLERAEVRRRAQAAASAVLPDGAEVWVVTSFDEALGPPRLRQAPGLTFERAGQYEHRLLEQPYVAHVAHTTWPQDRFDELVDAIAGDELAAVWYAVHTGDVLAPYDGGIDLLVDGPARVASLRHRFRAWLSPRADGL